MSRQPAILILDDEAIVGDRLKPALEKSGYLVETFTESQRAIDRLAEQHFDVLITDLKMSGPSGMDVLHFARENSPSTRVIVITGYATAEQARESMKSGAVDFIPKPFRISQLRELVSRILDEDSSRENGPAEREPPSSS